jgi:hypothetical protein
MGYFAGSSNIALAKRSFLAKVMPTRNEARKEVTLSVRIFGTDAHGQVFSETVSTVNVSLEGAMLKGVRRHLKPGEVIGLTYGANKARFRVQWIGQRGSDQEGRIGLRSVLPGKCLWDVPLPSPADNQQRSFPVARKFKRLKCNNPVELRPFGQPPVWSKIGEVGEGGCFVELMIPLQPGTRMKISLWLKDNKVTAEGIVVYSRPAYGVGIRFTEMSSRDSEQLKEFLKSMVRLPAVHP